MSIFETLVLAMLITLPTLAITIFVSIEVQKRKIKKMILSLTLSSDSDVLNEIYYHFFQLFRYYHIAFFVNTDKILLRKKLKKYQLWVKKIILPWDNLWLKVQDYQIKEISLDELKKDL